MARNAGGCVEAKAGTASQPRPRRPPSQDRVPGKAKAPFPAEAVGVGLRSGQVECALALRAGFAWGWPGPGVALGFRANGGSGLTQRSADAAAPRANRGGFRARWLRLPGCWTATPRR